MLTTDTGQALSYVMVKTVDCYLSC